MNPLLKCVSIPIGGMSQKATSISLCFVLGIQETIHYPTSGYTPKSGYTPIDAGAGYCNRQRSCIRLDPAMAAPATAAAAAAAAAANQQQQRQHSCGTPKALLLLYIRAVRIYMWTAASVILEYPKNRYAEFHG